MSASVSQVWIARSDSAGQEITHAQYQIRLLQSTSDHACVKFVEPLTVHLQDNAHVWSLRANQRDELRKVVNMDDVAILIPQVGDDLLDELSVVQRRAEERSQRITQTTVIQHLHADFDAGINRTRHSPVLDSLVTFDAQLASAQPAICDHVACTRQSP